jgi:hypothetical protein
LFLFGAGELQVETEIAHQLTLKIAGGFIAASLIPVALREGILYLRVLQPALDYQLEQISKSEILRKLNNASVLKPSAASAFVPSNSCRV